MQRYILRESSLLAFDERVLAQALDTRVPLGERCRFLSITESNADELVMVRLAGLAADSRRGKRSRGTSAALQLKTVRRQHREFIAAQQEAAALLLSELEAQGRRLLKVEELDAWNLTQMEEMGREILSHLTPLSFRPSHRLPHLKSRRILIAQRLPGKSGDTVKFYTLPSAQERFLPLPQEAMHCVAVEDLLCHVLGQQENQSGLLVFRLLRDEDLDYDLFAPDQMEEMERSLRRRSWGRSVGLCYARNLPGDGYDPKLLEWIRTGLDLPVLAVNGVDVMVDLRAFSKLGKPLPAEHFYPPFTPGAPFAKGSIMAQMEAKDLLVHVPYESYDPVLELLQEAAADPDVTEIHQTLYRVSDHSPVISTLVEAAQAGKSVTVYLELKARFDEAHNIHWAHILSDAGCRVLYDLTSLKVHGKALLITRGGAHPKQFLHLGTGNYNEDTARAYSDMHLLTTREELCRDVEALFHVLAGDAGWPNFRSLAVSPTGMRDFLNRKIADQITAARQGRPSGIRAKMNSLSDPLIIDRLYEASRAGVPIELVVRSVCSLRPGIKGTSDNIRVVSIVGRYLEHHRIYEFRNGEDWDVYLSSADWMPRNLNRRVEIAFPVFDAQARARLRSLLDAALSDNTQAWELHEDESWTRVPHDPEHPMDFQEFCAREAATR